MNIVILQVIFLSTFVVFSLVAFFFFISVFTGAPYVPTPMNKVNAMIKLADIKAKDRIVDLGSGDGRLLIETAKKGAKAYGVEINPGLWVLSLIKIRQNRMADKVRVSWGSLFNVDYSKYNVIFVAGFIDMMKRLEKDFEAKLRKGTKVICYAFPLPNKKPQASAEGVYFYQY
ncbi:MAG: hypothetical protein M1450_02280 [Patescibacteria group bacterium]|nr:hypothetical protein [Patescibacteria group bacterium]